MKICIIGLGRLGSAFATCWLKRGFQVVGVDKNPVILSAFARKESPVIEPEMNEILAEHGHNLTVTDNIYEAVSSSDITFVLVSTPSQPDGSFSPVYVRTVCEQIGPVLANKPNHIVVIASTISPGTIHKVIIPTLEESSGKKCGEDFDVCYVPEWVALGELVKGFLNPDFTLIGCDNPAAGQRVASLYTEFLDNSIKIKQTNIINAEISKVALNAYIATKITFANAIADYCEHTPGADASVVTSVIGQDSRIGSKYFKGGVSYGGPCFPRDILAFSALGGLPEAIAGVVDQCNDKRLDDLANITLRHGIGRTIGIFSMTFKSGTAVHEESPSVWLLERLIRTCPTQQVILYDPLVKEIGHWQVSQDLADCLRRSDVLVFMNPCGEFKTIEPEALANKCVIDCWGCLQGDYIKLGKYNEVFQ